MLLTQLLSASTLAVPVWAQSTYISHSDPHQIPLDNFSRNQQFDDTPHGYQHQPHLNRNVEDLENNNLVPYQQEILRQVEAYSKTYTVKGQDVFGTGYPINSPGGDVPYGSTPMVQPQPQAEDRTGLPSAATAVRVRQRPLLDATIAKKNWPGLQTKSLRRNKVQESFNRNVVFTGNNGATGAPVSIRTVSENVTNVRTESAWDTATGGGDEPGMWENQQGHRHSGQSWPVGGNGGVPLSSSSEVPVYSGSGQPVLSRGYVGGIDGMNRGKNGGGDRSRIGVRVDSSWNPYEISGRAGGVYGMENVSNNNNYHKKKNRVDPSGVIGQSVNTRGRNSTGHISGNVKTNNNSRFRETVTRGYQEVGSSGDLAKPTSSSAAVAGLGGGAAGSGAIVTDFWSNYGYKVALVTAAGLIGFLAFLGVVRCLRSSSPESGVIATTTGRGGSGSNSSNGAGSGSRGIRSTGLALSTSLLPEDDCTPLNNAGSPYFVPMLSVQSPGYAGMERLGVPARSNSSSSQSTTSPPSMVGLHHHTLAQHNNDDDDDDDSSSGISRSGSSRRTRMAPQRDYSRSGGNCNGMAESSSGSGVDMKLYVALESSSASQQQHQMRSHYNNPGYNNNSSRVEGGHPGRPRMGSDMNNGRCPHHVKLGDSEWGTADRPANNQIRVPYQAELTRTYIKPPPNKTALDVPDRDNCAGGGCVGAAAAAAMPSRNSNSNLLNFPYVHGMSASQEALSSSSGAVGGGAASSGVSKSSSKQSNFPFSRFFKSRGSNTSINNNNSSSSTGPSTKSRPESPCRYGPLTGAPKSTSAGDVKQHQQHQRFSGMPLSGSSISLASTVYANSGLDAGQARDGGAMVVDVTTSSTNYCVYVTASTADASASSYRSGTTTTTTTTKHLPQSPLPCDTNREIDLHSSSAGAAAVCAGATASSNLHNCNNLNGNLNHNSHHSKGGCGNISYGTNAVHSINSYHPTTGPQHQVSTVPSPGQHQQQQQHQTVSSSSAAAAAGGALPSSSSSPSPSSRPSGDNGSSSGGGLLAAKTASSTTMASCDKRVYVEKRIKTSDSESTDSSTCSAGGGGGGSVRQSAGFKGGMDTDQSV